MPAQLRASDTTAHCERPALLRHNRHRKVPAQCQPHLQAATARTGAHVLSRDRTDSDRNDTPTAPVPPTHACGGRRTGLQICLARPTQPAGHHRPLTAMSLFCCQSGRCRKKQPQAPPQGQENTPAEVLCATLLRNNPTAKPTASSTVPISLAQYRQTVNMRRQGPRHNNPCNPPVSLADRHTYSGRGS